MVIFQFAMLNYQRVSGGSCWCVIVHPVRKHCKHYPNCLKTTHQTEWSFHHDILAKKPTCLSQKNPDISWLNRSFHGLNHSNSIKFLLLLVESLVSWISRKLEIPLFVGWISSFVNLRSAISSSLFVSDPSIPSWGTPAELSERRTGLWALVSKYSIAPCIVDLPSGYVKIAIENHYV